MFQAMVSHASMQGAKDPMVNVVTMPRPLGDEPHVQRWRASTQHMQGFLTRGVSQEQNGQAHVFWVTL